MFLRFLVPFGRPSHFQTDILTGLLFEPEITVSLLLISIFKFLPCFPAGCALIRLEMSARADSACCIFFENDDKNFQPTQVASSATFIARTKFSDDANFTPKLPF